MAAVGVFVEVFKVFALDSSEAFVGADHRRRGRGRDLQDFFPGQGGGSTAPLWGRTAKRGSGGDVLRRDAAPGRARAVFTCKYGHYFNELLFWQTLALVFMRQLRKAFRTVSHVFYMKMNSDLEVDAPFARENLDMISKSSFVFWQSVAPDVSVHGGFWSDPAVDVAQLVKELFIWRLAAGFLLCFQCFRAPHLDVWSLPLSLSFWGARDNNKLFVLENSCQLSP